MTNSKSQIEQILAPLRENINKIDNQILDLLEERLIIVKQVSKEKHALNMPTSFPGREASMLKRLRDQAKNYPKDTVVKIWRENMGACMKIEGNHMIGTLRNNINNHTTLARCHYGVSSPLNNQFENFSSLFNALEKDDVNIIIVPLDTNNMDTNNNQTTEWISLLDQKKHFICNILPFAYELPELSGSRSLIIVKPLPETNAGNEKAVLISLTSDDQKHKLNDFNILSHYKDKYLINTSTKEELESLQLTFTTPLILGSYHKPLLNHL